MRESKTFRVWFGATLVMCAVFGRQVCSAQEKQSALLPERVFYNYHDTPDGIGPSADGFLPTSPEPRKISCRFHLAVRGKL